MGRPYQIHITMNYAIYFIRYVCKNGPLLTQIEKLYFSFLTLAFFKASFLNKTKMEKSKVKQSKIQTETKKTLTPMRELNESKTMKCS